MSASRVGFENALWKRQGGLCGICNECLLKDERFWDYSGWNLDHVYPRARYSRLGNRGNLLLTHIACNSAKGDREPTQDEIDRLHAVNRLLGHQLVGTPREYRDVETGPKPIEQAWQRWIARSRAAA